jgi:hypothetical protein
VDELKTSAAALLQWFDDTRQTASAVRHAAPMLLADGTCSLEAGGEPVACGGWSRRGRL